MLNFKIYSLFPEIFPGSLEHGLIGKAFRNKVWSFEAIQIRDYSNYSGNSVDDKPFSGGAGMILRPDVISESIEKTTTKEELKKSIKICFSAKGKSLNQSLIQNLKRTDNFILLSGRYEGIDQRVINHYEFEEVSIGDYILNGGESACMVFMEAIIRLQDNVLNNPETHNSESFQNDLLEHDQFTRPSIWNAPDGSSHKVPEELLNGNHSAIEKWKKSNSEQNTSKNRQDLWKNYLKNKKNE